MISILQGLAVLAMVIAVGFVVARIRLLPDGAEEILARLVFFVATPALLYDTLAQAPVGRVFSSGLAVVAVSTTAAAVGYLLIARRWRRAPFGEAVIGALTSCYVNAGNLGIPVSTYLFGSAAFVAPVMLYQLIVLAPIAFVALDVAATGRRPSLGRVLLQPVRNPLVLASALGVCAAVFDWQLPEVVGHPVELIAGIAVPGALLAFGMSLYGAPLPGRKGGGDLATILLLKLAVMPAVAYLVARFAFGMDDMALLSATVFAALPAAQNTFVYALRYRVAVSLARDAVLATTIAAAPVLIAIVGLVHP